MAKINPYLMVENGKEAIELYKDLFGAKFVEHTPFSKKMGGEHFGFPDDFDYENSTMHAILDIKNNKYSILRYVCFLFLLHKRFFSLNFLFRIF
jgi:uncharacterized glyoxalase superfamily protein PhnB